MGKSLKVFIESVDGDAKHTTKFSLDDATELERIIVIQNIFKVLGVDTAITEMLDDFMKIGKAYETVTATKGAPDPLEVPSVKSFALKEDVDTEAYIAAASTQHDASCATDEIGSSSKTESEPPHYGQTLGQSAMASAFAKIQTLQTGGASDEKNDTPSHFTTGIMHTPAGDRYQCRLHCERCGHRKTLYIKKYDAQVYCQACQKTHRVRPAKKGGLFVKDEMNNFFIAGTVVGEDESVNASVED